MGPAAQEAWRKTVVRGRGWKDWKAWFRNASPGEPREVAAVLASWAKRSRRGDELLATTAGKHGIEVIGYISKDAFIEEARDIASLFRCAEEVGATGSITFAGVGLSEAYRLELSESGSSLVALDEDLEASPEVKRICGIVLSRGEALQAAKAAKKAAKKGISAAPSAKPSPAETGSVPAGAGQGRSEEARAALEAVHARLAKVDDAALVEAAAKVEELIVDGERGSRLTKLYRGAAAVREGLRPQTGQEPEAFASRQRAAMVLLAKLERDGAEPLLRQLAASSALFSLRVGAVIALAGCRSDETVKVLFEAFDEAAGWVNKKFVGYDSPLRRAAARSLVATGRADVFQDVLGRLTAKACEMKAGPTGQHLAPEKKAYEKHDYIEGITYVLGHAKYRPAWDRLVEMVRTSQIISLRLLAIEALVRMAEPSEIEGALGEKANAFHSRAFGLGVFNPTKPEEIGKKLIAYVKKQKRSS